MGTSAKENWRAKAGVPARGNRKELSLTRTRSTRN